MKKLVDKTPALTGRLSGTGKAGTHVVNANLKSVKVEKLMEKIEIETTNSLFIKLMYQYIKRKHLQFYR